MRLAPLFTTSACYPRRVISYPHLYAMRKGWLHASRFAAVGYLPWNGAKRPL
jgi:hypothetical protein